MSAAIAIIIALLGMMVLGIAHTVNSVGKVKPVITPTIATVTVMIMLMEIAGLVYVAFQL